VKLGVVSYEGDLGILGDQMTFNGVNVTDALNPVGNTMNSTIDNLGSRVTAKSPDYVNQLGVDADLIALSNPSNTVIANNATTATVGLNSTGDTYYPGVITTSIDLYAPQIVAGKTTTDLNGGNVNPVDILEYTINVQNNGGDDASNLIHDRSAAAGNDVCPE